MHEGRGNRTCRRAASYNTGGSCAPAGVRPPMTQGGAAYLQACSLLEALLGRHGIVESCAQQHPIARSPLCKNTNKVRTPRPRTLCAEYGRRLRSTVAVAARCSAPTAALEQVGRPVRHALRHLLHVLQHTHHGLLGALRDVGQLGGGLQQQRSGTACVLAHRTVHVY